MPLPAGGPSSCEIVSSDAGSVNAWAADVAELRESLGEDPAVLPALGGARDDARDERIVQGKRGGDFSDVVGECGDDLGELSERRG
jgi:hypothetical protein